MGGKMLVALVTVTMSCAVHGADDFGGELRARWDARSGNDSGLVPAPPSAAVAEAELHGRWTAFSANLLLSGSHAEGDGTASFARFNELYASGDFGAWQASAGKKIVGWDVGYGFRPNDVVQQEERRTLLMLTQEGRPLVQLEHFKAESAASLVWVNPQHLHGPDGAQRFGRE